jgi:hypothetical protein
MSNPTVKKASLAVVLLLVLAPMVPALSPSAHAQLALHPPGYGIYLRSGDGWVRLEYQAARRVPVGEMGYVMGIMHRSRAFLRGERAPIRISGPYPFIYLHGAQPEFYSLVRLEARDGLRQLHYSAYTAGGSPRVLEDYLIPVKVERLAKDLYRLVPARILPPGEYGLVLGDHLCAFGVD